MCRLLGYIGEPTALDHVLFETDSSLVRQSYSPRMMATFLNLAGFGMAAWDPRSIRAEEPLIYRVTTMPAFDRIATIAMDSPHGFGKLYLCRYGPYLIGMNLSADTTYALPATPG